MREAFISADDIAALTSDLQRYAQILDVMCKGGPRVHTDGAQVSLDAALADLSAGKVTAVQIRYAYDNHEWSDTLLKTPQGTRLVRCQHPT